MKHTPPAKTFKRRQGPVAAPKKEGLPELLKKRALLQQRIKDLRDEEARKVCPFAKDDVLRKKGKRGHWLVLSVEAFPARDWRCLITTLSKSGKTGKGEVPIYDDEGWTIVSPKH